MNASHFKFSQLTSLACGLSIMLGGSIVQANMPATAVLSIATGSNFTMEVSPGFHLPTAITGNQGLRTFVAQSATGSHTGAPNGTESPGVDNPWNFFGNTGMHYTSAPAAILSDDGSGNVTLDLSGWGVTWNGIPAIPMGTGAWDSNPNGVAIVTCGSDCSDGDTYTLTYSATVPVGDPSSFGGVAYGLNLVGTISATSALDAVGSDGTPVLGNGTDGGTSANDYQISRSSLPEDPQGYIAVGSVYDFSISGVGNGGNAVITLNIGQAIPAGAIYRKYTPGAGWFTFDTSGGDVVESGTAINNVCLVAAGVVYSAGITAGDNCVRLTIQDGGVNDADGLADGTVFDPGMVAVPAAADFVDTRTSGSSGCTLTTSPATGISGEWLLIGGLLAGLGLYLRRRVS